MRRGAQTDRIGVCPILMFGTIGGIAEGLGATRKFTQVRLLTSV